MIFPYSSNKHSLSIGLSTTIVLILTSTRRMHPFLSDITFTVVPICQELRGAFSSTIRTTSPTAEFRLACTHFCRSCSRGKYFLIHLFQKRSAIYWTFRHLRRTHRSSLLNSPGGRFGFLLSSGRWFGVRTSKSSGSLDTLVMGLLFTIASTLHMRFWRFS